MNKTLQYLAIFLLATFAISCSKDYEKDNSNIGNYDKELISQYIMSTTNFGPSTTTFSYDDQGRNTTWSYTDLAFSHEEQIGTRTLKDQCLLNNQSLVSQAYTQTSQANYRRKITYDTQKRITQITVEEQRVNNVGTPVTNMQLNYTYDFNWDTQSNVSSVKKTYSDAYLNGTNTGGVKYVVYTYSGFSAEYPNTLKLANIGLDFFGPYGYPSILVDAGGDGGMLYGPHFMGQQLPARLSYQGYDKNNKPVTTMAYSYDYGYEKDSKGRISTLFYDVVTYRFSYR